MFLFSAGWLLCMSHAERDNAISHYCRGLCTYGRSRGLCPKERGSLRSLAGLSSPYFSSWRCGCCGQFFDWHNSFYTDLYYKGFWSAGRVSPCTLLLIVHNVLCLCIGSSRYCEEPGRVSVCSLQKWRFVMVDGYRYIGLWDYECCVICVWGVSRRITPFPLSLVYPSGYGTTIIHD